MTVLFLLKALVNPSIMASLLHTFNSDLVEAFQFGIGLGVLVLSSLILFPGRQPEEENDHGDVVKAAGVVDAESTSAARSNKTAKDAGSSEHRDTVAATNGSMKAQEDPPAWSPHRRLNTAVYVILLTAALAIWLSSYANEQQGPMIPYLLQAYFPRESSAFYQQSSSETKRP
jgi:hypothetical protein